VPDGSFVSARFELLQRLGAGGCGVVYRARDRESGDVVALKTLPDAEPAALLRFKREFRALADIHHPGLLPLYELRCEGAHWYFTMEIVDGVDFATWVRGAPEAASAFAATEAAAALAPTEPSAAIPPT
jgi:serine/threonine protein kinase